MKLDLNSDLGESFGAWTKGNDAAMLDIVISPISPAAFTLATRSLCARPCWQPARVG